MTTGFNALLGLRHIGIQDDGYWIELDAGDAHVHDRGFVHGGVILTLLDTAMARIARHGRDDQAYMPTIEFGSSFLRPIERGRIRACGKVLKNSAMLCRAEGTVLDALGRTCATGRATFLSAPRSADSMGDEVASKTKASATRAEISATTN